MFHIFNFKVREVSPEYVLDVNKRSNRRHELTIAQSDYCALVAWCMQHLEYSNMPQEAQRAFATFAEPYVLTLADEKGEEHGRRVDHD